jgi:hypothetical protein
VNSTVFVSNSFFLANRALGATMTPSSIAPAQDQWGSANGGAVFHYSGMMSIRRSVFAGNSATGGNGFDKTLNWYYGFANGGAVFNAAILNISDSTITSNEAVGGSVHDCPGGFPPFKQGGTGAGGGLYNSGTLSAVNCTIAANTAQGGTGLCEDFTVGGSAWGGGVLNFGAASFLNVTFAGNSVQTGADLGSYMPDSKWANGSSLVNFGGAMSLGNSIVACSPTETNVWDPTPINDGGHNICSDGSASFGTASSRNNLDPLLATLSGNGGPGSTVGLLPGSPAIDSGDDSMSPSTDQRGVPRPIGRHSDIGAVEYVPPAKIDFDSTGGVQVQFVYAPQKNYLIETSTNLMSWSVGGNSPSDLNGVLTFQDTSARRSGFRFYRFRPQ